MTRVAISRTALPATGLNLTDTTYTTMATGAGNGVEIPFRLGDLIVFNNTTGGPAVYTIKVPQPTAYSALGVTVPDITVTVAAAKVWVYPVADVTKQATGVIQVDCDVAGKIIAVAMTT